MPTEYSPETISVNGIEPVWINEPNNRAVFRLRNDQRPTRGNRRIAWIRNKTGAAIYVVVTGGHWDINGNFDGEAGHRLTSGSAIPTIGAWGYNYIEMADGDEILIGPFPDETRAGWSSYNDGMLIYKTAPDSQDNDFTIGWFELPA